MAFILCYTVAMKIIAADDVDFVNKPEGTSVHYYTFNDYEVLLLLPRKNSKASTTKA